MSTVKKVSMGLIRLAHMHLKTHCICLGICFRDCGRRSGEDGRSGLIVLSVRTLFNGRVFLKRKVLQDSYC